MKTLKTLVLMQLMEKLKNKKNSKKGILFNTIFAILKFVLVTAMCFLFFYVAKLLQLFSLVGVIPSSVLCVIFTLMLLVSILFTSMGLTKSMYYSRDNLILLTLPARPTQVFASKLIVFYIFEYIKNLSFMVPLFIAFGLINGYGLLYYPLVFIIFIFISLLPVLVGVIISIPLMLFYNIFRQYKRLQLSCLVIILVSIVYALIKAISLIPENIDIIRTWGTTYWQIQAFLSSFVLKFKPFNALMELVVGKRIGTTYRLISLNSVLNFIVLIGILAILLGLGLLIVKPLFYKMASKPFEYRKEKIKTKQNKVSKKSTSVLKNEFLLIIRNPDRLYSGILSLVALPMMIFLLNKIYAAMNTRLLGNNLTIAFNALIILLFCLNSNCYASSIFSRDGRSSYLIKVQPTKYQPLLLSKLLFNTILMIISFISTYLVLIKVSSLDNIKALIFMIFILFIYLSHLCFSAELDIMNPQTELYETVGNSENNPNESKSTIIAFLGSFVVFGICLFLLMEDSGLVTYYKLLAISILLFACRVYLFLTKIKLYYKEK